jgi:hypothetical protein
MVAGGNTSTVGEGADSNQNGWSRIDFGTTFTIPATVTAYVAGSNQTGVSTVGGYWKVRQTPTSGSTYAYSNVLGPTT